MNIYLSLLLIMAGPIVIVWPPDENPKVNAYHIKLYNKNYNYQLTHSLIRIEPLFWIPEEELMYNVNPGFYDLVIQPMVDGVPTGIAYTNNYYYKSREEVVKPMAPASIKIIE